MRPNVYLLIRCNGNLVDPDGEIKTCEGLSLSIYSDKVAELLKETKEKEVWRNKHDRRCDEPWKA